MFNSLEETQAVIDQIWRAYGRDPKDFVWQINERDLYATYEFPSHDL